MSTTPRRVTHFIPAADRGNPLERLAATPFVDVRQRVKTIDPPLLDEKEPDVKDANEKEAGTKDASLEKEFGEKEGKEGDKDGDKDADEKDANDKEGEDAVVVLPDFVRVHAGDADAGAARAERELLATRRPVM